MDGTVIVTSDPEGLCHGWHCGCDCWASHTEHVGCHGFQRKKNWLYSIES